MRQARQLALLMTIIERGCGNRLTDLYTQNRVFTHLRCEGSGTATSEILDILGLGSSEKDILLSLAPVATIRALMDALEDDLHEAVPGRGIAFTAPLDAVSNLMAAFIAARTKLEKEAAHHHCLYPHHRRNRPNHSEAYHSGQRPRALFRHACGRGRYGMQRQRAAA